MHSNRELTTRYLLPRTATLVFLVAIVGCDPGQDRDDSAQPRSDSTLTKGGAAETRPNVTDGSATYPTQADARDQGAAETGTSTQDSPVESVVAQIQPTSAGNAEGTVTFSAGENDREMRVTIELQGLEPGPHGLHIHEVGDCSAADASSAGGHFKPYDAPHGSPGAAEHHVGDMGNIEADDDGRVSSELSFRGLAFSGPASVLQKAVVIHRNADDLKSQPAGNAGARIGCGVIRIDR